MPWTSATRKKIYSIDAILSRALLKIVHSLIDRIESTSFNIKAAYFIISDATKKYALLFVSGKLVQPK
jgi:hypothetical protein